MAKVVTASSQFSALQRRARKAGATVSVLLTMEWSGTEPTLRRLVPLHDPDTSLQVQMQKVADHLESRGL